MAMLLSLYMDSVYINTETAQWDGDNMQMTLNYPNGSVAKIDIQKMTSICGLNCFHFSQGMR